MKNVKSQSIFDHVNLQWFSDEGADDSAHDDQAQDNDDSTDDLAKQLSSEKERLAKELEAERERAKKEIAGLNRKVSELEKERMTDEERRAAEIAEKEQAAREAEKKLKDYELQLARVKAFNEKNIKSEVYEAAAKIAGAQTADEVQSATEELSKVMNDLIQGGVESFKNERAKNAHVPKSGNTDTLTRADVLAMSDDEIAALPKDKLKAAMERY